MIDMLEAFANFPNAISSQIGRLWYWTTFTQPKYLGFVLMVITTAVFAVVGIRNPSYPIYWLYLLNGCLVGLGALYLIEKFPPSEGDSQVLSISSATDRLINLGKRELRWVDWCLVLWVKQTIGFYKVLSFLFLLGLTLFRDTEVFDECVMLLSLVLSLLVLTTEVSGPKREKAPVVQPSKI